MKKISSIILVMTLVFSACQDPFLGSQYIEKTNANLDLSNAEFLKKHEDKYSMWIELLKYANLYNALNDAAATSTVFAPDNEAVTKFLAWKGVNTVQELDQEYARNVAKAHILKGIIKENDFIAYVEKGQIPTMSLFGSYLTTSYGYRDLDVDDNQLEQVALRDSFSIYLNNQAKVANLGRADTTANGRVYTLHDVIRPLSETVLEVLENYKDYTIFVEAAKKTGYDQVVKVYADTVLNANGSISVNDVRFTCLAVPDEVYKAAGINSALKLLKKEPFILKRNEAYIGVLIDDLIIKVPDEPYRMFTSSAEYRLLLRQDNADLRLMEKGRELGLIEGKYLNYLKDKRALIEEGVKYFKSHTISPGSVNAMLNDKNSSPISQNDFLSNILRRSEVSIMDLISLETFTGNGLAEELKKHDDALAQIEIEIKYEGYIRRQEEQAESFEKNENLKIPQNFKYEKIKSISSEALDKLMKIKPRSIGQAARIAGVRPSDISAILIYMRK